MEDLPTLPQDGSVGDKASSSPVIYLLNQAHNSITRKPHYRALPILEAVGMLWLLNQSCSFFVLFSRKTNTLFHKAILSFSVKFMAADSGAEHGWTWFIHLFRQRRGSSAAWWDDAVLGHTEQRGAPCSKSCFVSCQRKPLPAPRQTATWGPQGVLPRKCWKVSSRRWEHGKCFCWGYAACGPKKHRLGMKGWELRCLASHLLAWRMAVWKSIPPVNWTAQTLTSKREHICAKAGRGFCGEFVLLGLSTPCTKLWCLEVLRASTVRTEGFWQTKSPGSPQVSLWIPWAWYLPGQSICPVYNKSQARCPHESILASDQS